MSDDDWENEEVVVPRRAWAPMPVVQPVSLGSALGARGPSAAAAGPVGGQGGPRLLARPQVPEQQDDDWFRGGPQSNRQIWDSANRSAPVTVLAAPSGVPPPKMQILKRPSGPGEAKSGGDRSGSATPKTLTQREEEYRLARERIFGAGGEEKAPSPTTAVPAPAAMANSASASTPGLSGTPVGSAGGREKDREKSERDEFDRGETSRSSSGRRSGRGTPRSRGSPRQPGQPDDLTRAIDQMSLNPSRYGGYPTQGGNQYQQTAQGYYAAAQGYPSYGYPQTGYYPAQSPQPPPQAQPQVYAGQSARAYTNYAQPVAPPQLPPGHPAGYGGYGAQQAPVKSMTPPVRGGSPAGPIPALRGGQSPGVLRQPRGPSGSGFQR